MLHSSDCALLELFFFFYGVTLEASKKMLQDLKKKKREFHQIGVHVVMFFAAYQHLEQDLAHS
jgi:hypothetical protein